MSAPSRRVLRDRRPAVALTPDWRGVVEHIADPERMSRILDKPSAYTDILRTKLAVGWQGKGLSPVMIEAKLELWDACASNLINAPPTQVVKNDRREPRSGR